MTSPDTRLSGLSREDKQKILKRLMEKRRNGSTADAPTALAGNAVVDEVPQSFYRFDHFPEYHQLQIQRVVAQRAGVENPFFMLHEGIARDTTVIGNRQYLNFATYNYIDLNGDPRIVEAAALAAQRYGTSASASRVVSGERPPHRELERGLADFLGTEDCIVFVSGHATNVSTIAALLGPKDLIIHDRLIHNSVLQGAIMSGAQRLSFAHNDMDMLDSLLTERRRNYEKVLIVVEGIYSMDGDVAPLPKLIELKQRHKALLMVDEAHSIGVLGKTGRGIVEHFGLSAGDVDILMGTLSKTFVGCGGYIAGSRALVELLKFTAGGFVYSVGMPPPMAAASKAALDILIAEPWRVGQLQAIGQYFLTKARSLGLDTGYAQGFSIVPIMIGRSVLAGRLSDALLQRDINALPIIYPAVEDRAARLRFFLSSSHSPQQIDTALEITAQELARLRSELS
jgi:8-amino-7-oxononanoate synthase